MLRRQLVDWKEEDVKANLERLRARSNNQGELITDDMVIKRRHKEGMLGTVGDWATTEYEIGGLRFESRVIKPNEEEANAVADGDVTERSTGSVSNAGGTAVQRTRARFRVFRSTVGRLVDFKVAEGEQPIRTREWSFDEYFSGAAVEGGAAAQSEVRLLFAPGSRTEVVSKGFGNAQLHVCAGFPLGMHHMHPIFQVMSATDSQYESLERFFSTRLPGGFPVKFSLPVFPAISALCTFQRCAMLPRVGPRPASYRSSSA